MKIIYFILILLIASCNSTKLKRIEGSQGVSQKKLKGKIIKIKQQAIHYPVKENGVKMPDYNCEVFYDTKNRVIRQIDTYPKYPNNHSETTNHYKNNLLESSIENNIGRNAERKYVYEYDSKKNLIKYNWLEKGELVFLKTYNYDRKNNIIEITTGFVNKKTTYDKFNNDYKNRLVTLNVINKKYKALIKYYYNKKGYKVKTEYIRTESKTGNSNTSSSVLEYDKFGDLKRIIKIKKDGTERSITEYKNTLDKKGNIIIREKYLNKKMIQKIVNNITYR